MPKVKEFRKSDVSGALCKGLFILAFLCFKLKFLVILEILSPQSSFLVTIETSTSTSSHFGHIVGATLYARTVPVAGKEGCNAL